jgi:hypothetical protein
MLKDLWAQVGCERLARDLKSKIEAFVADISFAASAVKQLWKI